MDLSYLTQEISSLKEKGRYRYLRCLSTPQDAVIAIEGKKLINFYSNNYLGLANHPEVVKAFTEYARKYGVGSGASRLISGHMEVHAELEEALARFKGAEACLTFGSGYLANLGILGTLGGPEATIFSDELNHASIVDGCRAGPRAGRSIPACQPRAPGGSVKGFPGQISATNMGAGKTYVTCLLEKRLRQDGVAVLPLKPVESGCVPGTDGKPLPADAAALRDAFAPGLAVSAVCLYPLSAALSSHLASRLEGVSIDLQRIRQKVIETVRSSDLVLVEGAGGITVEIQDGYSFANLARDLSLPVLIVAENRLGVLNHLQLPLRYLHSEGIPLFGVILNDLIQGVFPAREPNEAEVRRIAGECYLGRVPHGAAFLPEEVYSHFRQGRLQI